VWRIVLKDFGGERRFGAGKPAEGFIDEGVCTNGRGRVGARGVKAVGGEMRGAERNGDCEGGALAECAIDTDGAAVELDEFLDESQTDAAAFVGATTGVLHAVETVKEVRQFFCGDADAGVADGEFDGTPDGMEADVDAAFEGEFEGVGDEVEDDFLPHLAIDKDGFGKLRTIELESDAGFFGGGAKDAGEFGGDCGKVGGLENSLGAAGLNAREIEKGVDETE